MVQTILETKPNNIDHQDSQGRTALLWAAYKNADQQVFEYLIKANADVTIKVTNQCNPNVYMTRPIT